MSNTYGCQNRAFMVKCYVIFLNSQGETEKYQNPAKGILEKLAEGSKPCKFLPKSVLSNPCDTVTHS